MNTFLSCSHQCKLSIVYMLENRPLPLVKDVEYEYILVTQKDLHTRMRSSPFYLKAAVEMNEIQQYSDKYEIKQYKLKLIH